MDMRLLSRKGRSQSVIPSTNPRTIRRPLSSRKRRSGSIVPVPVKGMWGNHSVNMRDIGSCVEVKGRGQWDGPARARERSAWPRQPERLAHLPPASHEHTAQARVGRARQPVSTDASIGERGFWSNHRAKGQPDWLFVIPSSRQPAGKKGKIRCTALLAAAAMHEPGRGWPYCILHTTTANERTDDANHNGKPEKGPINQYNAQKHKTRRGKIPIRSFLE